jgi:hypothetical protein
MANAEAENVRPLHGYTVPNPDSVPSRAYPVISAQEILETDYPEPTWFIDELLPAGLTVFGGPPKVGKSWLALQFAVAVASGGHAMGHSCTQARVLYMSLEEGTGQGPMGKKRLEALAGDDGTLPADLFFVDVEQEDVDVSPQLGVDLEDILKAHIADGSKLIIIDTLGRVQSGPTPDYRAEVAELNTLARLCRSTHDVGILLVTHTTKAHVKGSDPFASIYGTQGLLGTAQQLLVLERGDGNSRTFHRRSRHVGDGEPMALQAKEDGSFTLLGAAAALQGGELSQQIVAAMVEAGASSSEPMSPADIKEALPEVAPNTIDQRLRTMAKRGQVSRAARGLYYPASLDEE